MRKFVAWVSILAIGLFAAYFIIKRSPNTQPQLITFTKSKTYSLTYPNGWLRDGGEQKTGFEILSIYNYDYRKVGNPDTEFGPGRIKIALSIVDKASKSLAQIIAEQYPGTEADFGKEVLMIDGRQAIRITANFQTDEGLSPRIETYIDYNDHQYAMLIGYYNGDGNTAKTIEKIQSSFKVLSK